MQFPDFYIKGTTPCSTADPDAFFPDIEIPGSLERSHRAKEVCSGCPYIAECFSWAMFNNEPGIWGGTNAKERDRVRRGKALRSTRAA